MSESKAHKRGIDGESGPRSTWDHATSNRQTTEAETRAYEKGRMERQTLDERERRNKK